MRATDTPARGGAGGQTSPPGSGPRHALRPQSRPGVGPWLLLPDRFRPRTVRAKIVSLLMVPVISLMALWAFATVTTARSVSEVDRLKEVNATLLAPVGGYVTAVQGERAAAVRYLAAPSTDRKAAYDDRRKGTDAAAVALRDGVNAGSTDAPAIDPDLPGRIDRLMNDADRLAETRKQVDARGADRERTFTAYTETVDHAFAVSGALTSVQNTEVSSETRVVLELQQARELIAREDALLGAAQAAGRMSAADHTRFAGAVQAQRMTFGSAVDDLRPEDADAYRKVLASEAYQDLRSAEDAVLRAGSAAPTAVPAARWSDANRTVAQDLSRAEAGASTAAAAGADTFSLDVLGGSGLAVVLGLAGVLLSLFISVRIGRGLVVELVELRNSALQLAGRELPRTMRRLHAGEDVDIDAEAPVRKHGDDEVGQVGAALDAVHRAALTAAAERAEVLSGISGVYVNLARRSQVLLHRQLGLLDTMERRTEDPTDLEDLFRLDHLTTRMRRHAESLIILSGAAPGRGWRNPVPLLDVVRAAVAEVEDFPRVEVRGVPEVRLSGTAVADITHLIAELVENAVAFSPPHTKVTVRGEQVGAGLVLEIEDAQAPWNRGRWRLTGDQLGAVCTRSHDAPDLTLGISALGSAYLGGTTLTELAGAGRIHAHRPETLAAATTAFTSPVAPWLPHSFCRSLLPRM
ncbi:ATP-binding protein [Streptomyces pathocidini]|uniref:ATP-binding protein n=1 Tax=Streptomyces pathocidini TaxID=1650571 RepID=UPI0006E31CC6|nr:ATP-binding protein [Streptomyces pathocidini]